MFFMGSKGDWTEFRKKLTKRQGELIERIQNHFHMETSYLESVGELSSYDNHPGDMGTEMYEREKDMAIQAHLEAELARINEALHAMADGTYGICRVCSMNISDARLKALPTADTCEKHAHHEEEKRERPVTSEPIEGALYWNDDFVDTNVAYDGEEAWKDVNQYGTSTSESSADIGNERVNYNEPYPEIDEQVNDDVNE